jgi:carbon-monoxide dehydrogenase small subunit
LTDAPVTFELRLTLNGEQRSEFVDTRALLVHAIRENFGLTGTRIGCLTGDCGACTVELDGRILKSCLVLAVAADGATVETVEGFGGDRLDPIQQAFWDENGFQCGFCLPGMLFAARDLLRRVPDPHEAEIRNAIDGNLCRCTGYENVVFAITSAASHIRGDAGAD